MSFGCWVMFGEDAPFIDSIRDTVERIQGVNLLDQDHGSANEPDLTIDQRFIERLTESDDVLTDALSSFDELSEMERSLVRGNVMSLVRFEVGKVLKQKERDRHHRTLDVLVSIASNQEGEFFKRADFALEAAVELTNSKIGYFALVDEKADMITIHSWSRQGLRECRMMEQPVNYRISSTGLWGEAIRQKKAIITNDYAAPDPHKKGLPKGHVRLIRHMNLPIFDEDGVIALVGVGNKEYEYNTHDLDAIRLIFDSLYRIDRGLWAKVALYESERRFEGLMWNAPLAIASFDPSGTMVDSNPRFREILGDSYSHGPPYLSISDSRNELFDKIRDRVTITMEKGFKQHFDITMCDSDNKRTFGVHIAPLDTSGKGSNGVIVMMDDVTWKRDYQSRIEDANRKLMTLSSITRHDILNQVQVINGYIDLMIESGEYDEMMMRKVEKANERIGRHLAFARDYTEVGRFDPEWIDLEQIVNGSIEDIDTKDLEISIELEGLTVLADRSVGRAFQIIVDNSARHAAGATRVDISKRCECGDVLVVIEDDGDGIPPEEKRRIFDRGVGRNNGLGLFLAKEILAETGMTIEETGDVGARFEILIPGDIVSSDHGRTLARR